MTSDEKIELGITLNDMFEFYYCLKKQLNNSEWPDHPTGALTKTNTEVDIQLDLSSGDLGSMLKLQGPMRSQIKKMIYNYTTKILGN